MKRVVIMVGVITLALSTMTTGGNAGALSEATSSALGGIEIGGYLDMSWTYNFNQPSQTNNGNVIRIFDTDHDDIVDFHMLNLYIDNLPEDLGEVGFRTDFAFGEDAELIGGDVDEDNIMQNDDMNIYQAYLSYIVPIENGLTIDIGRFATWHGYELIESPQNDNFSRSIMFGYAIPFTHTGIRMTYPFADWTEVSLGVTQGWDTVEDNNNGKTFHAAWLVTPMDDISIQNSVAYGPERDDNSSDYMFLYDLVATWAINEMFSVGANFNYGNDENANGSSDTEYWAVGGYARYDFHQDMYLALRGEYFDDTDYTRLPQETGNPNSNQEMWEITVTLGYEVTEDLLTRIEYRHDEADGDIFHDKGGSDDTQDTIALEVIYSF